MKKALSTQYGRTPWDRMMWIHEHLKKGKALNCQQIAAELEISERTVKRDVVFMGDRLKLPIVYDHVKRGYYYSKPVDKFPSLLITEAEMFGLLVAHKAIAQYHGTPFQQPLQTGFKKLLGRLDNEERYSLDDQGETLSFRPFAPDDADLQNFIALTRALHQYRPLEFDYKKLGAAKWERRRVHPYHLACIENHWYLFAFDVKRQAIRTFSVSRLAKAKVGEGRFEKHPDTFDADEYLKGSLGVFKGNADYEVVIDFDPLATDLVRGRHWHSSQEFTELGGGSSRMTMRLNALEEVERWVLSWGTHATVLGPKALVKRIRTIAEELVKRYAGVDCEEEGKGPAGVAELAFGESPKPRKRKPNRRRGKSSG